MIKYHAVDAYVEFIRGVSSIDDEYEQQGEVFKIVKFPEDIDLGNEIQVREFIQEVVPEGGAQFMVHILSNN